VSVLMHGLRLEEFTSEGLGQFMREFLCVLADDGTEGSGATLRVADCRSILPYFQDTAPGDIARILKVLGMDVGDDKCNRYNDNKNSINDNNTNHIGGID